MISIELRQKVVCPYCGHPQKIQYAPDAECKGVFIRCQARHCKKEFEIKVDCRKGQVVPCVDVHNSKNSKGGEIYGRRYERR